MKIMPFPRQQSLGADGPGTAQHTLTLPVAPDSYSRIRFDPLHSKVKAVPPAGALSWLDETIRRGSEITEVEISGPGDPLTDINMTLETIDLIHRKYPKVKISLTTIGLHGEEYARVLRKSGVSKVTLRVDAIEKSVAEKLYAWVRPGNRTIPLARAAKLLIDGQSRDVKAFIAAGCTVNVRTTVYPGVNDAQIEKIAQVMAGYGVKKMELVPCCKPVDEEDIFLDPPSTELMRDLQLKTAKHLASIIGEEADQSLAHAPCSGAGGCEEIPGSRPSAERPNLAVASLNGMEVDLHLGQAFQLLIYGPREDGLVSLLETRSVPEPGQGTSRWHILAESLKDCFAVLAASAGDSPKRILGEHGISLLITDGEIEVTVDSLYGGGKGKKSRP